MTLFSFLFVTLLATSLMASNKGQLAAVKEVLNKSGISSADVKIAQINYEEGSSPDRTAGLNFTIIATKEIRFMNTVFPKKTHLTYAGNYFQEILLPSGTNIELNGVFCDGPRVKLNNGQICDCRLSRENRINGYILPKKTRVIFENNHLSMFWTNIPWKLEEKEYSQGCYKIVDAQLQKTQCKEIDDFTCRSSGDSTDFEKAKQVLAEMNINIEKISIKSVYNVDAEINPMDGYEGFNITAKLNGATSIQGYLLPAGSEVTITNKILRRVTKVTNILIDGYYCSDYIEFSRKGKLCECQISKPHTIKGYEISPPATLVFYNKGFQYFIGGSSRGSLPAGYYGIDSKGKLTDPGDQERFSCEAVLD